jgi:hypothetical protein
MEKQEKQRQEINDKRAIGAAFRNAVENTPMRVVTMGLIFGAASFLIAKALKFDSDENYGEGASIGMAIVGMVLGASSAAMMKYPFPSSKVKDDKQALPQTIEK